MRRALEFAKRFPWAMKCDLRRYFPSIDHGILRERVAREGAPALHAELAARDPQMAARLGANDAPRILRALEVLETTGESITVFQANTKPALAPDEWRGLALTHGRNQRLAAGQWYGAERSLGQGGGQIGFNRDTFRYLHARQKPFTLPRLLQFRGKLLVQLPHGDAMPIFDEQKREC